MNITYKNLDKPTIYIDAGHGSAEYTNNSVISHTNSSNGKFHKYSNEFTLYEGYFNRVYANDFINRFSHLYNFITVYHPIYDTPLSDRTNIANNHYNLIKPTKSLLLSFHSNAFDTKARGWSIFTSKGITKSDSIAESIIKSVESNLVSQFNITLRKYINSDLQRDYEENFHMLVKAAMPAVLIENLFFDNYKDSQILMNPNYITAHNNALNEALMNYFGLVNQTIV